jgi:hypothetical protein
VYSLRSGCTRLVYGRLLAPGDGVASSSGTTRSCPGEQLAQVPHPRSCPRARQLWRRRGPAAGTARAPDDAPQYHHDHCGSRPAARPPPATARATSGRPWPWPTCPASAWQYQPVSSRSPPGAGARSTAHAYPNNTICRVLWTTRLSIRIIPQPSGALTAGEHHRATRQERICPAAARTGVNPSAGRCCHSGFQGFPE